MAHKPNQKPKPVTQKQVDPKPVEQETVVAETVAKPKETSLYLPTEVKDQVEALKAVPTETLVDAVRRLLADNAARKLPEGDTVTIGLPKHTYASLMMVLRSSAPMLAETVSRSLKK